MSFMFVRMISWWQSNETIDQGTRAISDGQRLLARLVPPFEQRGSAVGSRDSLDQVSFMHRGVSSNSLPTAEQRGLCLQR
jgi:hypothetical protein